MTQLEIVPSPAEDQPASLEERCRALFREGSPYAPVERSEIVGIDHVLARVDEVLHTLVHAERYAQAGARLEPGVLFAGPPGTGKTLAARYLATASGALFVDARTFPLSREERRSADVRALFRHAREARSEQGRPVILFWDELDAVCSGSPRSMPAVSEWLLSQVDTDASSLIAEAADDVRSLLAEIGGPAILSLAERLAERETFDGIELEQAIQEVLGELPAGWLPAGLVEAATP